ncbi:MAG TPA: hypothetical protein DCZ03_11980 [Gammaproteobacteria bacterium]|nr:hypothetical protein [Gammaproteobacteria bacterium]
MQELLLQADKIEQQALESLHQIASAEQTKALGLIAQWVDGAWLSMASVLPSSAIVINRCLGLGVYQRALQSQVQQIAALYKQAGVGRCFVHLAKYTQPNHNMIAEWLTEQGFSPARGWMKFKHTGVQEYAVDSELKVRKAEPADYSSIGQILAAAFDLGEQAESWLAALPEAENWHTYVTISEDQVAGTGSIYIKEGIGWLDWGATAPEFRRQGSQGLVLQKRLEHAGALGCEHLFTATGEAVAGDPQDSYHNITRFGFAPLGIRANYQPSH